MILKLVRTPGIYLVGFMGSGKSTIGRILADRLGWDFADLDRDIEVAQQQSIQEIFETRGEDCFRKLETEAIRKRVYMVRAGCPMVVALGGGAFAQPGNYDLLEDHGITIWLDCPLELALERVRACSHRPLARDESRFAELYQSRRASYERADYRIEITSADPEITADAIFKLPIF